jgi:vacuolar-type H+-ATPase subunit H
VIWPSNKESVEIIKQAKRKAQELISQAEASIKKEAKQRTQAQVEKLLNKARKEAEYIIVQAKDAAEEIRNETVAGSRQEIEQTLAEITEKCRQDARMQSFRVIAEARQKADKMMAEITTSSTEINRLVTDIVNRARNTISEFEERLQEETGELTKAIIETQKKLEEATMIQPEPEPEPVLSTKEKSRQVFSNPILEVRLLDENSNGNNGYLGLYSGDMEMRTASASFDYQYVKKLKKYLVSLPGIKYLQESASEKEMSVLFRIEEPLPLLDVLREVPLVENVVTGSAEDNNISLVFKNSL